MHAQQRHARRSELDGERDAVQPPADVDDDRHVVVGQPERASPLSMRAFHEQRHGAELRGVLDMCDLPGTAKVPSR